MKKVLSIIAMATLAVLFCGCNKENAPATGSKSVTISVSMPDDEITKTKLDGPRLVWKETDKIYVSGPGGALLWAGFNAPIIPSSISEDGKTADFTLSIASVVDGKKMVGYYGIKADSENDYANGGWYSTFVDDGISYISYTNPCVQAYYGGDDPNGDYLAMADINFKEFGVSAQHLQFGFKNLMSIIKIGVTSSRERTLSSIKVVGDGSPLSGTFYCWNSSAGGFAREGSWFFNPMTDNNDRCEPIAEDFSKGTYGNWVLLQDINKNITTKFLYSLVVFPGNHETLEITLTDKEGNTKVVKWRNRIYLEPGIIYHFPEIKWD